MQLCGARTLVTGATGGIGGAVATRLLAAGCAVTATGRQRQRLQGLAEQGVATRSVDLTSAAGIGALLDGLSDGLDLAVLSAGVGLSAALVETSDASLDALMETNVVAQIRLARALVPLLGRSRRPARLVVVGSVAGALGVPQEAAYAATKAAVMVLADSLRGELRPTGIGVTVLVPGVVATDFFARRGADYSRRFPRPVPAERVADALVRGLRRDAEEVVVPGWLRVPMVLRALAPQTYRRWAARWG